MQKHKTADNQDVIDSFGRPMHLCNPCYEDFVEVYEQEICLHCLVSANTKEYLVVELDEVVSICDGCYDAHVAENEYTLTEI